MSPVPRLEIWTARICRSIEDPDSLDITRKTADAYEKAIPGWDTLAERHCAELRTEGINRARRRDRQGIPLVKQHALALGDGLPSLGAPWAPSWDILRPALSALDLANRFAADLLTAPPEQKPDRLAAILSLEAKSWARYRDGETRGELVLHGFESEMRQSYRQHSAAWSWAIQRNRIVARCWCAPPSWWPTETPWDHCHRFLVAGLLVKAARFTGRDAVYLGEIQAPPKEPSPQLGLLIG